MSYANPSTFIKSDSEDDDSNGKLVDEYLSSIVDDLPTGKGECVKIRNEITSLGNKEGVKHVVVFELLEVRNAIENMNLAMKKNVEELLTTVPNKAFCSINFHHPSIRRQQATVLKPGFFSTTMLEESSDVAVRNIFQLIEFADHDVCYSSRFKLELIYFVNPRA